MNPLCAEQFARLTFIVLKAIIFTPSSTNSMASPFSMACRSLSSPPTCRGAWPRPPPCLHPPPLRISSSSPPPRPPPTFPNHFVSSLFSRLDRARHVRSADSADSVFALLGEFILRVLVYLPHVKLKTPQNQTHALYMRVRAPG